MQKPSELLRKIPQGATVVQWYDYYGNYEGHGAVLYQLPNGRWSGMEYSHCSCFGPEESYHLLPEEDTYELIWRHVSEYIRDDMPLLNLSLGERSP